MGNVNAVIQEYPWNWVEFEGDAGAYDQAGFRPSGLTYAPQQAWSEPENYGGNKHMVTQTDFGDSTRPKWSAGATEGVLKTFGTLGVQDAKYLTDINYIDGLVKQFGPVDYFYDGVYESVQVQPPAYTNWRPDGHKKLDPSDPTTYQTCTPRTFPYCTMAPMLASAGEVTFFDGKQMTGGLVYKDSIERAYNNAFVNGGIEALSQVNQTEHSTYDPCDQPSTFEVLFPLLVASGMMGAFGYYGKPELTLVAGPSAASVASVCIFGFGYNLSKGMVEYFHESDNHYYLNAARFLLLPLSAYAGSQLGTQAYTASQNQGDPTYFMIGGAVVGVMIGDKASPKLAKALEYSSILAAVILGTFGMFTRFITRFFCSLTANYDSCADYENDPTNRRWDAVSIASMLTLEVCEREGWQKDDARAEFVFRGLLYGPDLMNLPVGEDGLSAYDQTLVNPLGYIYSGEWKQAFPGTPPTNYQRSNDLVGWDGLVARGGDIANSNMYACENWDLMRRGGQSKSHKGALLVAQNINEWIGSWDTPGTNKGTLVEAANDPTKLAAMKRIPGWELQGVVSLYQPTIDTWKPLDPLKYIAADPTTPTYPLTPTTPWFNMETAWQNDVIDVADPTYPIPALIADCQNVLGHPDCEQVPNSIKAKWFVLYTMLNSNFWGEMNDKFTALGWDQASIDDAAGVIDDLARTSKITAVQNMAWSMLHDTSAQTHNGFPTLKFDVCSLH